jgi:3-hydroxyisobutyrate dehydrogenase-like beta-hydroxyacid dehydrogenase
MPETSVSVGWVGAGRMGAALCSRLLRARHHVAVYNRTPSKLAPLVALGATAVDRVSDLRTCDVVFTMVTDSAAFRDVTVGPDGLLAGDGVVPGVIVDSSTIDVDTSRAVRQAASARGSALLAAPVSGNPGVIESGRARVVVSGPESAFATARPFLDEYGAAVVYVGQGDEARLVKIAHNVYLAIVTQVLAEKGGVSRSVFLSFLNASPLGSMFSRYKSPAMITLDFTPTFTGRLLRKDVELGLAAAAAFDVPLPAASIVHEALVALAGQNLADEDFAALIKLEARRAGLDLESESDEAAQRAMDGTSQSC